jgi:predicted DNA-binding protein
MARQDPQIAARLKPETMAWVDEWCERLNMTRAEFIRAIVEQLRELPTDDPALAYNALQGVLVDRVVEGHELGRAS